MPPQPDKKEIIARLADRAKHLTALHESPSYPVFKEIVEGEIALKTRLFVNTAVVSPQQLDYWRGALFGMQQALRIIERGETEFRKAMRQAQALEALEGAEGE